MFGMGRVSMARVRRAGARGVRRLAFGLLAAGLLVALGASATAAFATEPEDFSGSAYQILAPGDGGFPPPERAPILDVRSGVAVRRADPSAGQRHRSESRKLYLSEKFGVTGPVIAEETLVPGALVIKRDKNDIPHVYGATRELVMFGSGWVAAEDRGLLLKMAVGPSFAATLDIPGINPFGLLLTGREFTPSTQTVNFVNAQKSVLLEKGAEGRTGSVRPRILGSRSQRLRGNLQRSASATAPSAPPDGHQRDRRLRADRLDLRQRRRQRSHQLELPGQAESQTGPQAGTEGLPRPA